MGSRVNWEMTQTESNITLDLVHGSTVREIFSEIMGSRVSWEMIQTESNITLDQVHGSAVREIFSDTMGSRVQQIWHNKRYTVRQIAIVDTLGSRISR